MLSFNALKLGCFYRGATVEDEVGIPLAEQNAAMRLTMFRTCSARDLEAIDRPGIG